MKGTMSDIGKNLADKGEGPCPHCAKQNVPPYSVAAEWASKAGQQKVTIQDQRRRIGNLESQYADLGKVSRGAGKDGQRSRTFVTAARLQRPNDGGCLACRPPPHNQRPIRAVANAILTLLVAPLRWRLRLCSVRRRLRRVCRVCRRLHSVRERLRSLPVGDDVPAPRRDRYVLRTVRWLEHRVLGARALSRPPQCSRTPLLSQATPGRRRPAAWLRMRLRRHPSGDNSRGAGLCMPPRQARRSQTPNGCMAACAVRNRVGPHNIATAHRATSASRERRGLGAGTGLTPKNGSRVRKLKRPVPCLAKPVAPERDYRSGSGIPRWSFASACIFVRALARQVPGGGYFVPILGTVSGRRQDLHDQRFPLAIDRLTRVAVRVGRGNLAALPSTIIPHHCWPPCITWDRSFPTILRPANCVWRKACRRDREDTTTGFRPPIAIFSAGCLGRLAKMRNLLR